MPVLEPMVRKKLHRAPVRPLPEVPEGWSTGPPDFIGVGAQRCGTSRWYALLAAHPGVHAGTHKEQHYFDRFWEPAGSDDLGGYARLFPRPPGTLVGEWTPRYLRDLWVPSLIAEAAPDAKVLVLLRDPVERFRSAMALLVRRDGELANDTRNAIDQAGRGRYAEQLAWLYARVPREQVLVQQYERCVTDPEGEIARLYGFLGLDAGFVPASLRDRVNAEGRPWVLNAHMERELHRFYAKDLKRLPKLAPGIDLGLWPSAR